MNTNPTTPRPSRTLRGLALLPLALALLTPALRSQTSTVTIDASSVVRDVPAGLGGVCAAGKFWNTLAPAYRADLVAAQIGLVRIVGYPADGSSVGTLAELDTKVAQLINAGATPLFIQCIESNSNTTFKNALLRLDGTLYPVGDTTPINQRVATNITYLVNRYKSAPFNLTTQYWEIGNEPDITVNYKVASAQEYIDFFSLAHNRLVASGVRGNVLLAGPVLSWDYGYDTTRDNLMRDFLTACANQVDIVTRHIYAAIYDWESIPVTPYTLLNNTKETLHFDSSLLGGSGRGEGRLLAAMNARSVPTTVGTGITEMNMFNNYDGSDWHFTITQGLWFLLSDHYSLYNPRSLATNYFKFDLYDNNTNGSDLAFYDSAKNRSYPYWAAYIHGALTGDRILAATSSDSHIVVTASKDDSYVYARVLNRHNTNSYTTSIAINNVPPVTAATRYRLTATETPDTGVATSFGTSFSDTFAPMTATIYRFPRTDAPTPPTPPAPPSTVVLTTDFTTAPAGIQLYANPSDSSVIPATNPANFQPLVTAGDLKLTTATTYLATAVVFNGQPLDAPKDRVRARFRFYVQHVNADGFVFGAYSASPGTQGNYGQALGYQGQSNRIWGVKVDNNPDQIAIVAADVDSVVEGWVTQPLSPYAGQEMYAVIDYDGTAGTVRARLYQGTDDTGVLKADITNRVGNPATLPAGTVFGFTGGTSNYSQTTLIRDLTITASGPTATWQNADVGAVAAAGSTTIAGGTYTVRGSGQYIWNALDEFQYAYRQVTGDCTITARIVTQQNTNANAQAGVMIRETLTTGSKHAMMLATPSAGLQFIHRNSTSGSYSPANIVSGAAPRWLRIVRSGQTFTAYTSTDGSNWGAAVGTYTYASPNLFSTGPVYIGLAVSSRADGTLCTATFDNVSVDP